MVIVGGIVSWVTDLSVSTAEGGPLTRSGAQVRTGWRCGSRGEARLGVGSWSQSVSMSGARWGSTSQSGWELEE